MAVLCLNIVKDIMEEQSLAVETVDGKRVRENCSAVINELLVSVKVNRTITVFTKMNHNILKL